MNLNFDILRDYLPEHYRIRLYGPNEKTLCYTRPLLYGQGNQMEPGRLYITPASALPSAPVPGAAVICVGGRLPQGWRSSSTPVMHIENSNDIVTVLQHIFGIYERMDQWDSQLRDELEAYEQVNLGKMLMLGAQMMDNHMGVCDSNLHFLYRYESVVQNDGSTKWMFFDDSAALQAPDIRSWEMINSVCKVEAKITEPYLTNAAELPWASYCCNLHYGGHFMGCIYISAQKHPFRKSDFALADRLFVYLKKALFRHVSMAKLEMPPEISALCAILDGRALGDLDTSGLVLNEDEYWVCFKLVEQRGSRSLPADYMCGNLNAFVPGWLSVVRHRNSLVGLIRLNHQEPERTTNLLQAFEGICSRMGYLAGISQEFQNLYDARPYYTQACYAADCAAADQAGGRLFWFRDYTLRYMMYACVGDMPQESLLPKGLLDLIRYDTERNGEYVKTLDVFLQTECNASQTAERLYIHRSSFVKRLNKIQQILALDLDDPDVRLLLRLCLKLL